MNGVSIATEDSRLTGSDPLLSARFSGKLAPGGSIMVVIQFPDRETEIKGLTVLMSKFSGKVLRGGLHIVPEAALEALTSQKIPYTVKGPATYEQEVAALRTAMLPRQFNDGRTRTLTEREVRWR